MINVRRLLLWKRPKISFIKTFPTHTHPSPSVLRPRTRLHSLLVSLLMTFFIETIHRFGRRPGLIDKGRERIKTWTFLLHVLLRGKPLFISSFNPPSNTPLLRHLVLSLRLLPEVPTPEVRRGPLTPVVVTREKEGSLTTPDPETSHRFVSESLFTVWTLRVSRCRLRSVSGLSSSSNWTSGIDSTTARSRWEVGWTVRSEERDGRSHVTRRD